MSVPLELFVTVRVAVYVLSALLAGAATSSAIFIFARIIGGFGVGAASVISPVYISEVTPASIRGRLSSVPALISTFPSGAMSSIWKTSSASAS